MCVCGMTQEKQYCEASNMLHTHALRFQNMPNLGIPFVDVKYEWDFLNYNPAIIPVPLPPPPDVFGITEAHVLQQIETSPIRGRCSIDLEPGSGASWSFLLTTLDNNIPTNVSTAEIQRLRSLMGAFSKIPALGRLCSFYGRPYRPSYYLDVAYHKNAVECEIGMMKGLGLTRGLRYTSFDYYWRSDVGTQRWKEQLALNLQYARSFGLPLQVWWSPIDQNPNAGIGEIPFAELLDLTTYLVERLRGTDELLWWYGWDFLQQWDEGADWVGNVFRWFVPPV